jgi:hypothetical protein
MTGPTLRVEQLPHLGPQARQVSVTCRNRRTAMSMVPLQRLSFLEEGMPYFKAGVIYRHESECGKCDTSWLWASERLLALRDAVDSAWDHMVADALKELAN